MTRLSGYRDLAHEPKDPGSNPGTMWKKKTKLNEVVDICHLSTQEPGTGEWPGSLRASSPGVCVTVETREAERENSSDLPTHRPPQHIIHTNIHKNNKMFKPLKEQKISKVI